MLLPDVLGEGLVVVFAGTATSRGTERIEAYYAARGNRFWSVLSRTGITPRQLRPEEYGLVLAYDIGLADVVQTRAATEEDLSDADFDVVGFKRRIKENEPKIVAFNGKEAAKRALGKESVSYGLQKEKLGGAALYVLPSTSERARAFWDEKHWIELAQAVKKLRKL